MNINLALKNQQSIDGVIKKIEYQRKENGLFEVTIRSFYIQDDQVNQIECDLKLNNAKIVDVDEESGSVNITPYLIAVINYDENHNVSIIEKDRIK